VVGLFVLMADSLPIDHMAKPLAMVVDDAVAFDLQYKTVSRAKHDLTSIFTDQLLVLYKQAPVDPQSWLAIAAKSRATR
jgi:hypothetical protein